MLDFQLFRVKVFPPKQGHLFKAPASPPEILYDVISSLPSVEVKKGVVWRLGNVFKIDNKGLYFRIGRTTKVKFESYKNGTFIDEEFEGAPYTHVFLDLDLELIAIAKKLSFHKELLV